MKPSMVKAGLYTAVTAAALATVAGLLPAVSSAAPATPELPQKLVGKTIFLDPGHQGPNHSQDVARPVSDGRGGSKECQTTGMTSVHGIAEHTINWDVAQLVRTSLEGLGAHVVMSRPDDTGWGGCIDDRARAANQSAADVAVSIHADSGPADGRGFHLIVPQLPVPDAKASEVQAGAGLAANKAMRDAYVQAGFPIASYNGAVDGLQTRSDVAGPALTEVPDIFLEMGNGANVDDAQSLETPEGQLRHAVTITTGIVSYLLGVPVPGDNTAKASDTTGGNGSPAPGAVNPAGVVGPAGTDKPGEPQVPAQQAQVPAPGQAPAPQAPGAQSPVPGEVPAQPAQLPGAPVPGASEPAVQVPGAQVPAQQAQLPAAQVPGAPAPAPQAPGAQSPVPGQVPAQPAQLPAAQVPGQTQPQANPVQPQANPVQPQGNPAQPQAQPAQPGNGIITWEDLEKQFLDWQAAQAAKPAGQPLPGAPAQAGIKPVDRIVAQPVPGGPQSIAAPVRQSPGSPTGPGYPAGSPASPGAQTQPGGPTSPGAPAVPGVQASPGGQTSPGSQTGPGSQTSPGTQTYPGGQSPSDKGSLDVGTMTTMVQTVIGLLGPLAKMLIGQTGAGSDLINLAYSLVSVLSSSLMSTALK